MGPVRAVILVASVMTLTGIAWAGFTPADGFNITGRKAQAYRPLALRPTLRSVPGIVLVGASFTITGTGFTPGSLVNFFVATSSGAVNAGPLKPSARGATTLTIDVPVATILGQGFVAVQVVNSDQGFVVSNTVYALLQGFGRRRHSDHHNCRRQGLGRHQR